MGILSIAEFVKQGMKTRLKSNIFYVLCFFKFQKINMQKNHVSIFLFSINFLLKEVKLCPFFELLRFSNDTDAEVVACSTFRNDLTSNKKTPPVLQETVDQTQFTHRYHHRPKTGRFSIIPRGALLLSWGGVPLIAERLDEDSGHFLFHASETVR